MKKARHLLLLSPLLPGESLPSYLVRLAKLNGYHTPNMVAQICQERLSQPDGITHLKVHPIPCLNFLNRQMVEGKRKNDHPLPRR